MLDWAPPAIAAMEEDAANQLAEQFAMDNDDVDILHPQDLGPEEDDHMFDLTAEEMAHPPAADTIMAPPPAPPPLPAPSQAPSTPPKKATKEPPMSQAKRAKGAAGTPIKKPTMADGLDNAYRDAEGRSNIGTVVFLAGTRNLSDVADDILIMEGRVRETEKYRRMREWLFNLPFRPTMIVGHSLGAAVARALAEDMYLACTTFNDPTPSWNRNQPGNFSSAMDPVSFLNWGQQSSPSDSWNPHSYHKKASHRSYDLDPHANDDIP